MTRIDRLNLPRRRASDVRDRDRERARVDSPAEGRIRALIALIACVTAFALMAMAASDRFG